MSITKIIKTTDTIYKQQPSEGQPDNVVMYYSENEINCRKR